MKKFLALALALCMVFALCACGQQAAAPAAAPAAEEAAPAAEEAAAPAEAAPAEKIPLKMSHHPYMHALPSIYNVENGLYDCFDYTIDYYAGGPVQNEAIASGAWEVGTTGIGGAVLGIPGYNMKLLGIAQDEAITMDAWCRADSALAKCECDEIGVRGTAEDWKGLDILIATGTNTHLACIKTLDHLGLTESDVNLIDCSSVPNIFASFMAGEGDVAFVWAPYGYTFILDEANYSKVCDVSMFGISMPTLVMCTEEAYNNRPEVVKQWLELYYKGVDGLMADTAAAAELLNDFEEEQGIVMDLETANMEFQYRPFLSLDEVKEYFVPDENGVTKMYTTIMDYAAFNVAMGKMTQEEWDEMAKMDFVSDFILDIE